MAENAPAVTDTDDTTDDTTADTTDGTALVEDVLVEEVSIDGMCGVY